jgi:hypothetical protein
MAGHHHQVARRTDARPSSGPNGPWYARPGHVSRLARSEGDRDGRVAVIEVEAHSLVDPDRALDRQHGSDQACYGGPGFDPMAEVAATRSGLVFNPVLTASQSAAGPWILGER